MRWQSIATDWSYYLPKAKRHWLALSDRQLGAINGSYERLVEALQQSYGLSAEVVKDDIREWCTTFGEDDARPGVDSAAEPIRAPAAYPPAVPELLSEPRLLSERHFARRPYSFAPR